MVKTGITAYNSTASLQIYSGLDSGSKISIIIILLITMVTRIICVPTDTTHLTTDVYGIELKWDSDRMRKGYQQQSHHLRCFSKHGLTYGEVRGHLLN